MLNLIFNEMTLWLLGTAVLFTFVGRYMAYKEVIGDVVESTIDNLIKEGYIKTKGSGENLELLKYWEHNNES